MRDQTTPAVQMSQAMYIYLPSGLCLCFSPSLTNTMSLTSTPLSGAWLCRFVFVFQCLCACCVCVLVTCVSLLCLCACYVCVLVVFVCGLRVCACCVCVLVTCVCSLFLCACMVPLSEI